MKKMITALFFIALATPMMLASSTQAQNVGAIVSTTTSSVAAAAVVDATSSVAQSAVTPSEEPAQSDTQQK